MAEANFDPIRSEDYVAPLQESYKAINEGMNNYWNQETSNAQRAAEIAGRDVQALADMSSTLGEYFTKKDEEKKLADKAKGYMWMQENGIEPGAEQAFKEAEAQARLDGTVINEEIYQWEASGGDIWTSESFRNMNASEKLGAVTAWSQMQAAQYNPAEATKGASSYEEYNAALTNYRFNFYKKFGDINPAILNEHVFGTVRKSEQNNYSEWYSTREAEIQKDRNEKYANEFSACTRSGGGTQCFFNYRDSQTIHGMSRGDARRNAFKLAKEMAANGTFTKEMYVDLLAENRMFEHAGKQGKMSAWNDEFFEDMQALEDAVYKKEIQDYEIGQSQKKIDNAKEYDAKIQSFEWTDYGLLPKYVDELKELKRSQERRYGFSHPKLTDAAIKGLSHKENYYTDRKEDLKSDIMSGEIMSTEDAERLGYEIPVFMDQNIQTLLKNVQNARFDYEKQAKYIEELVLRQAEVTNETRTPEVGQIIEHLQGQLKRNMIAAAIADPDNKNIGSQQYELLKNIFIQDITQPDMANSKYKKNNNWSPPQSIPTNITTELDANNTVIRQKIDSEVKKGMETLTVANTYFSPEQLIKYGEDFNKGSLVVPARATYIARWFGNEDVDGSLLTGLDVINYQRKAINLEPLEVPDVLTNLKKLPKLSQKEMLYSKVDSVTNRVVGENKEVVEELSKSMLHPVIQEYLNENSHQSQLKGGQNLSLEGYWQQARILENKLKEVYEGDEPIHTVIENVKKKANEIYKKANSGEKDALLQGKSNNDKQQWRRKNYLETLAKEMGVENITEWVNELNLDDYDFDSPEKYFSENDEGAETVIEQSPSYEDLAVSMDFLKAYDFDIDNVPIFNGEFSAFDQNRFDQLMYKHTGSMEALGKLVRPAFMQ